VIYLNNMTQPASGKSLKALLLSLGRLFHCYGEAIVEDTYWLKGYELAWMEHLGVSISSSLRTEGCFHFNLELKWPTHADR